MGERKVQAKYYPPDFDPSKLPRIKTKRQNDDAVRFMLPMSVRCQICGEFMGTGLKFNARKSDTGDNYLGIRIFRFSMKCKACPATFTIITDPKNSDYTCETGVRRNYEPWREAKAAEEEGKEERKRQDEDAMQKLENRTKDAKQEMEDLDALDELKTLNAKRATISVDDVLRKGRQRDEKLNQDAEQQMLAQAREAFKNKRDQARSISTSASKVSNSANHVINWRETRKSISISSLGLKIIKRKSTKKRSPTPKLNTVNKISPKKTPSDEAPALTESFPLDFSAYPSSSESE